MSLIRNILISSTALILGVGCTNNFDDYNKNPNSPELWSVGPSSLLEETLFSGADGLLDRTKSINGELIQYTVSGTSLNAYHRYVIGNGIMTSAWSSIYRWAGNAEHMVQICERNDPDDKQPKYKNNKAVALTLKVLLTANATDIYGDVPYNEAFKAYDDVFKPKFDTQKDIYTAFFKELERANSLYDTSNSIGIPAKDLLYNGDMKKWQKFNNSLYLRLLMRLSNRDSEMGISAKMAEILSNPTKYPIFESNADNAALFYTGVAPFQNRYGGTIEADFKFDRKIADNMIAMMSGDPRLPLYFVKGGSEWKGLTSGEAEAGDADGTASLNKTSLGMYTSPYAFMKYDEVLFIVAEAVKRGMIPGGDAAAKVAYDKAITASVKWWNSVETSGKFTVTDDVLTAFINESNATYNNTLERILNKKYVAMFFVGYEAWNDYSRTEFPKLKPGSGTQANNFTLPTRFAYPITLVDTNPDNYKDAVLRLVTVYKKQDNMQAPVWWSKLGSQY